MSRWSHPVASFWAGEDLSFVEQMVIRSYLDQGCDFTLYLGHPVGGIPAGTPVRDASEILPRPAFVTDQPDRKALAAWSDYFRMALLRQSRVLWVDLDAYCQRPFDLPGDYAFAAGDPGQFLCGVLGLPQTSPALARMTELLSGPEVIPPWIEPDRINRLRRRGPLGPMQLPWGSVGPHLLNHALHESGEDRHALPPATFYPAFRNTLSRLWHPGLPDQAIITPDTLSVHIFGFTKRVMATHWQGLPPPGSWLARAAARHGIDPRAAPATGEPLEKR